MAICLLSNGHISAHFDTIQLKLSTDSYFEVPFQSMLSKYENSKIRFFMRSSLMNSIAYVSCQFYLTDIPFGFRFLWPYFLLSNSKVYLFR